MPRIRAVVSLTTSREPETQPLGARPPSRLVIGEEAARAMTVSSPSPLVSFPFHNEDGTAAGVVETMPHRPI
jgi:hypothetical protein